MKWLNRRWEVPDKPLPEGQKADAAVSMSLSPAKDGSCGLTIKPAIKTAVSFILSEKSKLLILSNRLVVAGKNLAVEEKSEAMRQGAPISSIRLPEDPCDKKIRNTFEEARFAVETVLSIGKRQPPKLLIIANHLHMRRVLRAFKILSSGKVDLYWISVRDFSAYTGNVHQVRFKHPSWFLIYEIIALALSKLRGWA